jgi:hypothetical protein
MTGFNGDGLYAVVTPTDALPVTMVTSNIPTAARTSAAQKVEKKICTTSLILKTAHHDKKLWLVPVEAICSSYGVRPPWNPQQQQELSNSGESMHGVA